MGCGQKAYYERIEEEIYNEKIEKVKQLTPYQILKFIEDVRNHVEVLVDFDIPLTRTQAACLGRLNHLTKNII